MDFADLERRYADLVQNMVVVGADGKMRLSPEFDRLQAEIDAAVRAHADEQTLRDMAHLLALTKQSFDDADMAQMIGEAMTRPVEPDPPIFEAIDACDPDAVRAALQGWDVNQRHGEFDATALYHAMSCMTGVSLEIMVLLLDAGADPRQGLGETNVLHGLGFANLAGVAPEDLAEVVTRCVNLGADLEQRSDKLQWTPLITAVSEWNPIATEALLLAGAQIGARAGEVEGVCFSGADVMAFADGDAETMAVLQRFSTQH